MRKILITGTGGFIGSHGIIRYDVVFYLLLKRKGTRAQEKRSMTGKDAMDNTLFGILKNNEEMKDSVAFAEKLAEDVFNG